MDRVKAIILAAGKGSRLASEERDIPKALRLVNGKPLIEYVLDSIDFVAPEDITVVVGVMGQQVIDHLQGRCRFAWQQEQKGTAHAMLSAQDDVAGFSGPVLALYCDMPLLSGDTYRYMVEEHVRTGAHNTLLASVMYPIPPFGRLIHDDEGRLKEIVEQSACTEEQKLIDLVNVGVQVLEGSTMVDMLKRVDNDNPKREYYLTGVVRVMYREGLPQHVVTLPDSPEFWGVNTQDDLDRVEDYLRQRA